MILQTAKPNRKGLSYTVIGGATGVMLYDTYILLSLANSIILDSGGFRTNHTKNVMNDFLNGIGMKVYQKNFTWYVEYKGDTLEFKDDMRVQL